jgi:DNA mismatch repair protein MutL
MPQTIKILPDHVINKIAAGEVVERPASVVKELVENSIDAGATDIGIDIEQAGSRLIRVIDNGSGMSRDDARTAFERHATSKITTEADLESVSTMGFRGEALSSIASVSRIKLLTAVRGTLSGVLLEMEGGVMKSASDAAAPEGTSLEINHLFYNTPARLKFLKSPATEFSHIVSIVSRLAMAYPSIRFRLVHNKKPVLDLPISSDVKERAFQLYGREIVEQIFEIRGGGDSVRIHGFVGRPANSRADRTYQDFYVNCRAVKNASLTHALYNAYDGMLMRGRHPVGFIFIEIDPSLVDVNVHPAKAEVRFRNQAQIHDLLRGVIREGLRTHGITALENPAASASYEDRVKEALGDYLKRPASGQDEYRARRPYPLYGRRRSDEGSPSPEYLSEPSYQEMTLPKAPQQPSLLADQGMTPLAQVHDSYIVAQSRAGMILVDQHAAHERVLFEELQDQFMQGNIPVQDLLIPVQVELGPAQGGLLAEYVPELAKLGFLVEDFGSGAFMIKAIPFLLIGADYKQLILDILDEVNVHGGSGKLKELRDDLLSVMACHPAIKIHRKLDYREMDVLLERLFRCRMPHTCPHGRPTMVSFTLDEIRKLFKRT